MMRVVQLVPNRGNSRRMLMHVRDKVPRKGCNASKNDQEPSKSRGPPPKGLEEDPRPSPKGEHGRQGSKPKKQHYPGTSDKVSGCGGDGDEHIEPTTRQKRC